MNATAVRQNLLSGLIMPYESEIPLIVAGSAASGGHGRTDPVGESPDYHYSAIFPIRMVAQLSAN